MRGSGCGAAEEKQIYKPIYIYKLIHTLKMHISVIFHQNVGGAVSQLIGMKFGTIIELTYVINVAKFGVDWSQGWGLVSSQILRFCLYWRSCP